jgi:hypothetical protein
MNAVFTIVAKNYLALAKTLGDSLRDIHPDLPFYIFLVDEAEGEIDLSKQKHNIIEIKNIGIADWKDMAFKYDVVEFNTSVKPFCFKYLFENHNCNSVLYLDPDICVYDRLDSLFDVLSRVVMVITPHVSNLEIEWKGALSEKTILVSGIYNLGFFALRRTEEADYVLSWWCEKLRHMSYADKNDGLFYDQKWVEFLISRYNEQLLILKDCGYNIAWWNLHERSVKLINGKYYIENNVTKELRPLIFFHFSGFDALTPRWINRRYKNNPTFHLEESSVLGRLFMDYSCKVIGNGHLNMVKMKYKYNYFENGKEITKFYRRIYRELVERNRGYIYEDPFRRKLHRKIEEKKYQYKNPFLTDKDSYYELLKSNGLLVDENGLDKLNYDDDEGSTVICKIKILTKLMKILKNIIGIKTYLYLMKFLEKYTKEEYQIFLIKELD